MKPKVIFTFLLIGLATISYVYCWSCIREITKIGCYKQYREPFSKLKMLFNDRSNIDWADYDMYLNKLVCECAEAAGRESYMYFSIRYYGECMGGNLPESEVKSAGADKRSKNCVNGHYGTCSNDGLSCAGGGMTDSLFMVKPFIIHLNTTTTPKPLTFHGTRPTTPTKMTFPPIPNSVDGFKLTANGFPPILDNFPPREIV